jgi:membrane-associated phospholipid phosphatase
MKGRLRILLLLLVCEATYVSAQMTTDSLHILSHRIQFKTIRIPLLLLGAGIIATTDNEVLDKWEVDELRLRIAPNFHTHADNYLQYAPIAAVYRLRIAGVKAKHDFANQTALLVKSELLMSATVFALKHISSADRPGTETETSFPSGHTAQAFVAATVLHKEYGKDHPWISVAGYATATCVGALRILNNKHWISDVLVGAGIGMLSTNLVYATHRNSWGKRKTKSIGTILPTYQRGAAGLYVSIPVH